MKTSEDRARAHLARAQQLIEEAGTLSFGGKEELLIEPQPEGLPDVGDRIRRLFSKHRSNVVSSEGGVATVLPARHLRESTFSVSGEKCPTRGPDHSQVPDSDISSTIPDEFIFYMHQFGTENVYKWDALAHPNGFKFLIGVSAMFPQLAFVNGTRELKEWVSNMDQQQVVGMLHAEGDVEISHDTDIVFRYLIDNPQVTDLIAHSRGFAIAIEAVRKLRAECHRKVAVCGVDGSVPLVSVEDMPGQEKFKHCGTRNISSDSLWDKLLSAGWTMDEKKFYSKGIITADAPAIKAGHRQYVLGYSQEYIHRSGCNMNDITIRMSFCSGFPEVQYDGGGMCRRGTPPIPFSDPQKLLMHNWSEESGSLIPVGSSFYVRKGTVTVDGQDTDIVDYAFKRIGDRLLLENKEMLLDFRGSGTEREVDLCWVFFMEHLIPLFAEKLRTDIMTWRSFGDASTEPKRMNRS